jgi:hypothetical protein
MSLKHVILFPEAEKRALSPWYRGIQWAVRRQRHFSILIRVKHYRVPEPRRRTC